MVYYFIFLTYLPLTYCRYFYYSFLMIYVLPLILYSLISTLFLIPFYVSLPLSIFDVESYISRVQMVNNNDNNKLYTAIEMTVQIQQLELVLISPYLLIFNVLYLGQGTNVGWAIGMKGTKCMFDIY